jgi:hypothetical protein
MVERLDAGPSARATADSKRRSSSAAVGREDLTAIPRGIIRSGPQGRLDLHRLLLLDAGVMRRQPPTPFTCSLNATVPEEPAFTWVFVFMPILLVP